MNIRDAIRENGDNNSNSVVVDRKISAVALADGGFMTSMLTDE